MVSERNVHRLREMQSDNSEKVHMRPAGISIVLISLL